MTNDAHNYTHHRKDIENTSGNEEEQPLKKARTCKDHVVMVSPELTPATAAVLKLTSCLDDDHNNSNEYNCVSGDEDWYSYAQHVPVSPLTSQQQQAGKEVRFHLLGADTSTNGTVSRSISPIEELEAAYACDAVELPPLAFQPRISKSIISRQRKKKFMRRSRVQACRISDRFSPKGFMMPLSASSSLTDSSGSSGNGKEATIRRQCSSFSLNQLTADMARIMSN